MNIHDRISALETELRDLKQLAAKDTAPPKPKDLDRPLISFPQPLSIELPDAGQQRKLVEIISDRHPRLRPRYSMKWFDQDELEFFAGFLTSMRFISTLGRAASVDTTRYLSFWTDQCKDWARLNEVSPIGNVGASFYIAAIAMRVPYVLGDNALGNVPSLGLKQRGGLLITADDWKTSLAGGVAPPVQARRYA